MSQDGIIAVANNVKSRNDLVERGFSRQPLRIDVGIAHSLEALAHAAWSIPKDKYLFFQLHVGRILLARPNFYTTLNNLGTDTI